MASLHLMNLPLPLLLMSMLIPILMLEKPDKNRHPHVICIDEVIRHAIHVGSVKSSATWVVSQPMPLLLPMLIWPQASIILMILRARDVGVNTKNASSLRRGASASSPGMQTMPAVMVG